MQTTVSADQTQSVTWIEDRHRYLLEVCREIKLLRNLQISENFTPLCLCYTYLIGIKIFKLQRRASFISV